MTKREPQNIGHGLLAMKDPPPLPPPALGEVRSPEQREAIMHESARVLQERVDQLKGELRQRETEIDVLENRREKADHQLRQQEAVIGMLRVENAAYRDVVILSDRWRSLVGQLYKGPVPDALKRLDEVIDVLAKLDRALDAARAYPITVTFEGGATARIENVQTGKVE
jgi:hypothetical protein